MIHVFSKQCFIGLLVTITLGCQPVSDESEPAGDTPMAETDKPASGPVAGVESGLNGGFDNPEALPDETTGGQTVDCESSPEDETCVQCDQIEDCALEMCRDEVFCQPCSEGGSCLFDSELYIFGEARTRIRRNVLTDLGVRANCGGRTVVETVVDNEGLFEIYFDVAECCRDGFEFCDDLVVAFERGPNVQGYVPQVYRFSMPPPVNAINIEAQIYDAEELRCDGVVCNASNIAAGSDDGSFQTGYAYDSRVLTDIANFGAIFTDQNGELLWLQRFIYRDYRDDNSVTQDVLPRSRNACMRLNNNTRSWVTDVTTLANGVDYHNQSNSRHPNRWEDYERPAPDWTLPAGSEPCAELPACLERTECAGAPICNHQLTDPRIDPDGDGLYDTIEMYTYQLDILRGHWQTYVAPSQACSPEGTCPEGEFCSDGRCYVGVLVEGESCSSAADCPRGEASVAHCVDTDGEGRCFRASPTYSSIAAVIESGYASDATREQFSTIGNNIVVPVPAVYLEGVQTTGTYGPAYSMAELDDGRTQRLGVYGSDYACIPHKGSGIYAIGYPMPRSCFVVNVTDDCGVEVFGAELKLTGVDHGFGAQQFTNVEGYACLNVARSEAFDRDFDGDGKKNETFEVVLEVDAPLNSSRLRVPADQVLGTPTEEGTCETPELCEFVEVAFQSCLPDDFFQP